MIIDIHRHPVAREWFSEKHWRGFAGMVQSILKGMGMPATIESVLTDFLPMHFDTEGEKHLEQMEAAGIQKTVMFLFDVGLFVGEPEVPIEEQNKAVFKMARKYPDQIIPFAQIDPRRPGAVEFVKKCVEKWGAKGLKLHPSAGFNPEESHTLDLIEAIADYGIPVITHTGASIPPTSSKYCDPIYLDEMLLKFPEVNVIAAHMAYGHRNQLFSLGWQRPNLYTDISAWQSTALSNYPKFARTIRDALDHFGTERVLFGTDSPYFWAIMPEKDYVQTIRELPNRCPEDIKFTENEVEMILGGNAKRLLNL